jgi:hypothetical protein
MLVAIAIVLHGKFNFRATRSRWYKPTPITPTIPTRSCLSEGGCASRSERSARDSWLGSNENTRDTARLAAGREDRQMRSLRRFTMTPTTRGLMSQLCHMYATRCVARLTKVSNREHGKEFSPQGANEMVGNNRKDSLCCGRELRVEYGQ